MLINVSSTKFIQLYIVDYHVVERALKERYLIGRSALAVLNCSQSSPSYASSSLKLIKLKQVVELTFFKTKIYDNSRFIYG